MLGRTLMESSPLHSLLYWIGLGLRISPSYVWMGIDSRFFALDYIYIYRATLGQNNSNSGRLIKQVLLNACAML
nr:hypothetical protein Q903MT_gene2227 [Picea sitchensis]